MRAANKQISLRPQDLVVVLKLVLLRDQSFTYASLGSDLALSPSEVHASIGRATLARLVTQGSNGGAVPNNPSIREFVLFGVRYAFPPVLGPISRGMPTAYGAPIFSERFEASESPVWPAQDGKSRGPALYPLYASLPIAASKDPRLYDMAALVDAIRVGAAREREFAASLIVERLT